MQGKSLGTSVIFVALILNMVSSQSVVQNSGIIAFSTGVQSSETLQHSAVGQSSVKLGQPSAVQLSTIIDHLSHNETIIPQSSATTIQQSMNLEQSSATDIQPSATITQMSATSTIIQTSATINPPAESDTSVILTRPIETYLVSSTLFTHSATYMDLESPSAISVSSGKLDTTSDLSNIMPTHTQFISSSESVTWTGMGILHTSTLKTPVLSSSGRSFSSISTLVVTSSSILDSSTMKNSSMWSPTPTDRSSISTVTITMVTSNPCLTPQNNATSSNSTSSPQEVNCTVKPTLSPIQGYPTMHWSLGAIIGTILGIASFILIVGGIVAFMLYCRRSRRKVEMNKDTTTSYGFSYFSTNWSDSVTSLNYLSTNIPLPKENEDEMVSVDDDAFLNSLDSSTFANFWNDPNMKNTRV